MNVDQQTYLCLVKLGIVVLMKLANPLLAVTMTIASSFAVPANADTVNARCEYHPNGQSRATVSQSCTLSQRQRNVSIQWADGVRNEFTAVGNSPGNYVDQRGGAVYRQAGLGDNGVIFKMPNGAIYVYWNTASTVNRPAPPRKEALVRCDRIRLERISMSDRNPPSTPVHPAMG